MIPKEKIDRLRTLHFFAARKDANYIPQFRDLAMELVPELLAEHEELIRKNDALVLRDDALTLALREARGEKR